MPRQRAEYTVSTRKGTDNTHVIRIELPSDTVTGKRKRLNRTFRGSKSEAKKYARGLVRQRDAGVELSHDKITVANWLEWWLKRHHAEGNIVESVTRMTLS